MFADEYLQMEVKSIKIKREKRMQARKAQIAAQSGWCLEIVLFH